MSFHYGIVLYLFLSLASTITRSQILFFRQFNTTINGTLVNMDSLRFSQKIITFKAVEKYFQTTVLSLSPFGSKSLTYNLTSSQQLRPDESNYVGGPNNFTTFTPSVLTRFVNNFTIITSFYTLNSTNQTFIDCFHGSINGSLGVLIKNSTSGFYHMLYFMDQVYQTSIILPVQVTTPFVKAQVSQGNCHLLFQQAIYIYSLNSSLSLVKKITFTYTAGSILSLNTNSSYLGHSYGNTAYIYSIVANKYTLVDSVNISSQIIDLRISYPYVLISTTTTFFQYDIDAKLFINSFSHSINVTGLRFSLLSNLYAIFYQQPPTYTQYLYAYKFDNKSTCVGGCTTCPNSYSLDPVNLWCIKNYSAFVVPVVVVAVNTTNIINSTFNTSVVPSSQVFNTSSSMQEQNEDPINKFIVILGKGLTFSSFRLTPKIFVTFTFFVDDIQLYSFHRNKYTESVVFFMSKATIINDIKTSAWFFQLIKQIDDQKVTLEDDRRYMNYLSPSENNPKHVYFLTASQPIYKSYLLMVSVLYICSKILYFLTLLLKDKIGVFRRFSSCIKSKATLGILFIALMEPNISQLSFNCFLQLKLYFSFQFTNTLNLIACTLTLYLIIFYTIALYPLSLSLGWRSFASQLLVRSKYSTRSFWSEGCYFCCRAILKSFAHAFLIDSYQIQLGCIIAIDGLILIIFFINRRTFQNFVLFVFFFGYALTFMVLNICFEIERALSWWNQTLRFDTVNFVLILTMIGFALLATVLISLVELNKLRKKFRSWFFQQQVIVERQRSRKALALSMMTSQFQSHNNTPTDEAVNKICLAKISIYKPKKKPETNLNIKWPKSIRETNKSMVTKQDTNAELQSKSVLQRAVKIETNRSKALIKIKNAKMKKFIDDNKEHVRKLIRLESQKWNIQNLTQ